MAWLNSLPTMYRFIGLNRSDRRFLDLILGQASASAQGQRLIVARAAAIALNYGATQLVGDFVSDREHTLSFLQFIESTLVPQAEALSSFCLGTKLYRRREYRSAMKRAQSVLEYLENLIGGKSFMLGHEVSFADIGLFCVLIDLFILVLHPEILRRYRNVTRWFKTMVQQPEIGGLVGSPNLCAKAAEFDPVTGSYVQGNGESDVEEDTESAKHEDGVRVRRATRRSEFKLARLKHFYSQEEPEAAIRYFWQFFDATEFSIWYCEYKNPASLTLTSISCHLIMGIAPRQCCFWEKAFASMCLFGDDNHSTISGVWVWRGHDMLLEKEGGQYDYGSYHWRKLGPQDARTRIIVNEYFALKGSFGGKTLNRGMILK